MMISFLDIAIRRRDTSLLKAMVTFLKHAGKGVFN